MGREIRRVPPDWEHPRNEKGYYQPLYDQDYTTVAAKWLTSCIDWSKGEHTDQQFLTDADEYPYYWDYSDMSPDKKYYRPAWTPDEMTAYQVYENVTEGTPVSPVFDNLDDLIAWLIREGFSEQAARRFAESGWAPTGLITPNGKYHAGIRAHDVLGETD